MSLDPDPVPGIRDLICDPTKRPYFRIHRIPNFSQA
jgi:hypothetical protein